MATIVRARRRTTTLLLLGLICALMGTSTPAAYALSGDIHAHDPSFIKSGSCYYAFSTGDPAFHNGQIQIRRSCNLTSGWALLGTVFNTIPSWINGAIGSTPSNIWAPDINNVNG